MSKEARDISGSARSMGFEVARSLVGMPPNIRFSWDGKSFESHTFRKPGKKPAGAPSGKWVSVGFRCWEFKPKGNYVPPMPPDENEVTIQCVSKKKPSAQFCPGTQASHIEAALEEKEE